MLQQNNPDLDMQDVAQKAQHLAEHRRRDVPLFADTALPAEAAPEVAPEKDVELENEIAPNGRFRRWLWTEWRRFRQPGLSIKQRIRVLPVVGAFFGWMYSLLMINRIRADFAVQLDALRLADAQANAHASHLSLRMDALERRMESLQLQFQHETERWESADIAVTYTSERLLTNIASQEATLARLQNDASLHIERDGRVAALQRSIRRLEQRLAGSMTSTPASGSVASSASSLSPTPARSPASGPDMGSFYIEFENRFRGSREEIKRRLSTAYHSYLAPYIGDPTARAVDVGAGRGEWLELMRDNGISAIGIDLDRDMVDACQEAGFEARHEDALQYLARQPEGSIAIISGFHIIEHLPFEVLIGLFDAALHALRPDGMIIFETPNPENIVVGSCNFYYDPTHLNPVVPYVAEFMARQRGFARAEILRLHAYPNDMQLAENSELARRFNQLIYGPQDFAVLGWKTSPAV